MICLQGRPQTLTYPRICARKIDPAAVTAVTAQCFQLHGWRIKLLRNRKSLDLVSVGLLSLRRCYVPIGEQYLNTTANMSGKKVDFKVRASNLTGGVSTFPVTNRFCLTRQRDLRGAKHLVLPSNSRPTELSVVRMILTASDVQNYWMSQSVLFSYGI